jgi:predicted esterase
MREHHLSVSRTARYHTLGTSGAATRAVWFVCHGYGQLAVRFLQHFAPLDDGSRLIVAPEGLSRFYVAEAADPQGERKVGASWMTREDRLAEIDDYVRYLDAVYADVFHRLERRAVRVTALGFSQGAATVSRWAALGTAAIDHLVLWAGELPPDLDLRVAGPRFRSLACTLVYGRADEFVTAERVAQVTARLGELGITPAIRTFAGGHELDATVLKELAAS